jgi:hypothetical protein
VCTQQFKEVRVPINDASTLVLNLSASEFEVAGAAATALEKHADLSDRNKEELVQLGVLAPATKLLGHAENSARAQASALLYTLTGNFDVRQAIRREKLTTLDLASQLLKQEEGPIITENVSGICANMCTEYSSRCELTNNGGMNALIQLLNVSVPNPADKKAVPAPPDLMRNLTRALLLGMEEFDTRAELGKLGAIESMFMMLDVEYNEIQSLAMQCLVGAAKNADNRMIIRVCGGLMKLIEYLQDETYVATHEKALAVLGVVLQDPVAMELVSQRGPSDKVNPNGTPAPVVEVIKFVASTDHDVAINALRCIRQAGNNAANRRRFTDQRTEEQVSNRLWSDDAKNPLNPRVGLAAIHAVTSLSRGDTNSEELAGAGAITKLTKLLSWDDDPCKTAAMVALQTITAVASNRLVALEAETAPKMLDMLDAAAEAGDVARLEAGAEFVFNMARTPETCAALLELGPVARVARCIGSTDTKARTAGCKALAVLAQNKACCTEVAGIDGVMDNVTVAAGSPDIALRQAALRCVRACAADRVLAGMLSDAGALETIQSAAASVGHPSTYATTALQALLDHNLAAKYMFRNELGMSDAIEGLTFDAGRARAGQAFTSLKALSSAPLNGQRAVLLVNLLPAEECAPAEGATAAWAPPADPALIELVAEVKAACTGNERADAVQKLANMVCDRLGGAVASTGRDAFSFELATTALKKRVGSNVVPLGELNSATDNATYTYFHRALLFKVLADQLSLPTALIRGEYNRAYNIVYLASGPHVVDVTHQPGTVSAIQNTSALHLSTNFFENFSKRNDAA